MRKLYFLLPGTDRRFACGGLWAELKTFQLAQAICDAAIVTYKQQEPELCFLPDLLQKEDLNRCIFVVSWGFHVPKLVRRLTGCHVIYHAHSSGYGFRLPPSIPIMTVSRNTMGYWGQKAPNSLIYYLPNHISEEFCDRSLDREIDVLVQARKSSDYLLQQLIPALQNQCKVKLLEGYIEDLADLFNRSKAYLYDSAEYWAQQGVSEGFGLQPMEALACGCHVFSSLNGGLSDYLDPGFNCHKIAGYSTAYDVQRILKLVKSSGKNHLSEAFFREYRAVSIKQRLQVMLEQINEFFDHKEKALSDIPSLDRWRLAFLFLRRVRQKIGL
jgi:hypothetical protein